MSETFNRTYLRSHPWITFKVDLRGGSPNFWIALGEAKSKCDHLADVPLKPDTAEELHRLYLVKGVLATTAIEGNTLTEEDVQKLIDGTLRLPESKEYLAQEVQNILDASNEILERIKSRNTEPITPALIKRFNAAVLKGIKQEEFVVPGEYSKVQVGAGRYKGAPVEDFEFLIDKLCAWINGPDFDAPPGMELGYGIIKAALTHLYLVWIHPFGDGNGRTARLLEVKILMEAGAPSAAAHLMSNYYNRTRTEYYRKLDETSESGGDALLFLLYAINGFVEELREQIKAIRAQTWEVAWENFVHECFQGRRSPAQARRRRLTLAISLAPADDGWIEIRKLRTITPELAIEYSGKTPKTITRDINELVGMKLVDRVGQKVRAKKERILAFRSVILPQP